MRRWRLAIVVLVLALPAAFAAQAAAATFTVGTTSDTAPGTPCTPSSGTCSLRELIEYENGIATPSPPDVITVPAGTYDLTNGPLTIKQSLSIVGASARTTTVAQTSATPNRVFDIQIPPSAGTPTPPNVVISGLEITGGTANANNGFFGGDVHSTGILTLSEDWITGGTTIDGSGGGVSNDGGTLTVTHSLVSGNQSTNPDNAGGDSGGIQNVGPNPTTGAAGFVQVDNSTITGNTAALGGGIFSWCRGANSACSSNNGGTNTTDVFNSTIAYNDGGTRSTTGGGLALQLTAAGAPEGVMFVQNSILAFNTVSSGATQSSCSPGGITSNGNNIETGTDCGFAFTGDHQSTNPKLTSTSPQNNGGNTDTFGLSPNSPAVDAVGQNQGCGGTDQRDVARPEGLGCDIGAFELVPTIRATEGGPPFSGQLVPTACPVIGMQINWGDGTQSPGTATGQGTHPYAEEGTYTGSITWNSDDCGNGANASTFIVQVADAALNNASGTPVSANAGQPFSGPVATFSDSDPGGTASDYTATINWGDGTTSAGTAGGSGPFTISGTHTYAAGGSYPVSVTIADAGGATTVANTTANVTPQNSPVVFTGPPAVKTSSGAVFSGSVNPLGLPTTAYFQYGLDSSYGAAADGPTYTASTPAQPVGSDFSAHAVSATVSGLVPNAIYHVRLVASNSAGTTYGPDQTFMTSKAPPPGSPTLGKTFNLAPVSGVVLIKVNNTFVPVTELLQIPSNTEIDALHGTVELITAGGTAQTASSKGHKTQTGKFGGAIFRVAQARSGGSKGQTTLSLVEGAFAGAPTYASCKAKKASDASSPFAQAASLSSSVLQTLHASAHGRFRTRGRYSAATVRGTIWTTVDRCDGTLTSVQKDTVLVTDFVSHKTILLHTGQHYLAKAPTGRHK